MRRQSYWPPIRQALEVAVPKKLGPPDQFTQHRLTRPLPIGHFRPRLGCAQRGAADSRQPDVFEPVVECLLPQALKLSGEQGQPKLFARFAQCGGAAIFARLYVAGGDRPHAGIGGAVMSTLLDDVVAGLVADPD